MQIAATWTEQLRRIALAPRATRDCDLISAIRALSRDLIGISVAGLAERCDHVRMAIQQHGVDEPRTQIDAFALMIEALRRARGIVLYDVQILASLVLARGGIAEMQTGEGKTFSAAPAAFLHALTGRGVHLANPNSYLAERDCELLRSAFELLGVRVGLLAERAPVAVKRIAYQCDITYGTGHEFGFDYLRDQLTLRIAAKSPLGETLLQNLAGSETLGDRLIQRGLYYSIVDEADNVLLDDAVSPLILSGAVEDEARDADIHRAALSMIDRLIAGKHYREFSGSGFEFTAEGFARIHDESEVLPIEQLQRTWAEYLQHALKARLLTRDVHYIVDEKQSVQIVDGSTGRVFTDRTWKDGLHQAIEAKEGLKISGEKQTEAQITRQRFARLYERLAGMTGTATGCEREFRQIYQVEVHPIPLRTPSRRELWSTRFFVNRESKWNAIMESVAELHSHRRPVLVGTRSIADSVRLAELFRQRGIDFQLLNGRQDAEEAELVARAGQLGAVTIATALAGRGTDIKLTADAIDLGGLHVVVSECDDSTRVDRQLIGRCGRQGDPGSAQVFVSAEDSLLAQYGPWLSRSFVRLARGESELDVDLMPQIRRIQRSAERMASGGRAAMLRQDLSRDSLYSGQALRS